MHQETLVQSPDPIEKIILHPVALPLVEALTTSFTTDSVRDSLHPAILVEMHVGGAVGWGECVAGWSPGYSYETIGTAMEILTGFFIPSLIGKKDLSSLHKFRGHPMARMAVEAAFWT